MFDIAPDRFDQMVEADVREDILVPLLARLGFSNATGSRATIRREYRLQYPKLFLGRKKAGKDFELRGVADYLLEVENHARWTLEAKAPSTSIDEDAIQQAWTYAAHPEVQAVHFGVANGREFQLFATASAFQGPLLSILHQDLDARFSEIVAFLAPASLARRYPNHLLGTGLPLGPGLRALHTVAGGTISHQESTLPLPLLSQMQVQIVDGTVRRDEHGKLLVAIKTKAPFRRLQLFIDSLGLDVMEFRSTEAILSGDPTRPTLLEYQFAALFPGYLHPTTYEIVPLPQPLPSSVAARVHAVLDDYRVRGAFEADITLGLPHTKLVRAVQRGIFEVRLA